MNPNSTLRWNPHHRDAEGRFDGARLEGTYRGIELEMNVVYQGVSMWRCRQCGAWSHARHKPRWHRRGLLKQADGWHPAADPVNVVLDEPTRILVRCGPFERWIATPG